jgi:hypothetical protein
MNQEIEKIKVIINDKNEIEIMGNRSGLKYLSDICKSLSEITDEESKAGNNHYHIADYMYNAESGSVPLIVWCFPDL